MHTMDTSRLVSLKGEPSAGVHLLQSRSQANAPSRNVPRGVKRQRCNIVCFANEHEEHPRPAWHTLPIKHVLESQQFDKVTRPLNPQRVCTRFPA